MKRIAFFIYLLIGSQVVNSQADQPIPVEKKTDSFYTLSPVEVRAIRASDNAPFTRTNLSKSTIVNLNLGQDIPFLLNQTPSVVINSDAGNGIGYTGIRIRGTDATRINITLNGIPYNDAESQGTFFVDLPDFSSSTSSIQVQRGVGTSSNGAGAFGGSIHFSTNEINKRPYAEFNNSLGSFNTFKHTIKAGTGLISDHFVADIRLSSIRSDGFIDRASSRLKSYYFSTAYLGKNNNLRLNIFSGNEKTYQAWYGISETDLREGHRTINYAGTEKQGEPYHNETDNFRQDHYQLFYDQKIGAKLLFNTAFFLTKGKGYYEQYKAEEEYASYGMTNPGTTDLVRQLWLDNDFYGTIFSIQHRDEILNSTFGGALTRYEGDHFGEIIWAMNGLPSNKYRWYEHDARKTDLTLYLKEEYSIHENWNLFGDLQFRHLLYKINGFRDNPSIVIEKNYDFINPKAGISFRKNGWRAYASYGLANKEPNRDDFEAGLTEQPRPERLHNLELGIERTGKDYSWGSTLYFMGYKNQLVLTGKINDVGAYTRTNIPHSYRAGIELEGSTKINSWLYATGNLAVSMNKVKDFSEFIDDYDNGGQKLNVYGKTDIAYSPNIVAGAIIRVIPFTNLELNFPGKYVGEQFLDNTSNPNRKLNGFYVQDAKLVWIVKSKWSEEIRIIGQLNNVFGKKYEPNGYTFSYIYGGEQVTENYYFPMAGTNFMIGLNLKL